jgi:DNA-binding NtrC family response regulator
LHEEGFTLHGALYEFEAKYVEQALEEAGGSVTQAARLLGIPYQSLTNMLKTRHRLLLKKRTPAKRRRRSLFKTERDAK